MAGRELCFPKAAWQMTHCIDLLSGEAQECWESWRQLRDESSKERLKCAAGKLL